MNSRLYSSTDASFSVLLWATLGEKMNKAINFVTLTLLLSSAILNIVLANKVSDLRNSLSNIKEEGQLKIGSQVPKIDATDLAELDYSIEYSEVKLPTILYIFTPDCIWCKRNLENVKAMVKQTDGKYRMIGLSLTPEKLKEYLYQNDAHFPVYTNVNLEARKAYKMGGTPQTIIVSPDGSVLKNWHGAYMNGLKTEINNYLQVNLPGISSEKEEQLIRTR